MASPVETVSERKLRKERELKLVDQERLRRHKEKRRLRRQNLKPRLSYGQEGDGWQLTIPASRLANRAVALSALALVASLALTYFTRWGGVGVTVVFALVSLGPAYILYANVSERKTLVRFQVAHDGGFLVRGWRPGLLFHRGARGECAVSINYDLDTALAYVWLPGDKILGDLGDQDLSILRSFCDAAGVPITSKAAKFAVHTPDEADARGLKDYDDYLLGKEVNWAMAIFLGGVLVVLAWPKLFPRRARPEDDPLIFTNKSLTGTFRSTNKELGEWTLTPSACVSGRERGFEGIAFSFPAGGPVEEIRIDTGPQGDSLVEVRLADGKDKGKGTGEGKGTVARFRNQECEAINGTIQQIKLELDDLPLFRLKGHEHFSCPAHGLSGDADFDGCLPRR